MSFNGIISCITEITEEEKRNEDMEFKKCHCFSKDSRMLCKILVCQSLVKDNKDS